MAVTNFKTTSPTYDKFMSHGGVDPDAPKTKNQGKRPKAKRVEAFPVWVKKHGKAPHNFVSIL